MKQVVSAILARCGAGRRAKEAAAAPPAVVNKPVVVEKTDEQAQLVQCLLDLGAAAILLRPAIAATIAEPHLAVVRKRLQQEMAWTAAGDVQLVDWLRDVDECRGEPTHREHVDAFLLDRHPVTNRRFREFVANGGYAQEVVWDAEFWLTRGGIGGSHRRAPAPGFGPRASSPMARKTGPSSV